ncbi:hypothetical protein [Saccharothrix texasensis]|uniref:Uncharacterized protein n=1 Tax=Saccharothrix texasensis TaxID=103734 RepID=A0A3N1H940_9PSEU|nr:hypothetical protein [Saccharothrix texasensis]ROP38951.1 hypothetical protein EDD40_4318 [Saccharothrix texasensis]
MDGLGEARSGAGRFAPDGTQPPPPPPVFPDALAGLVTGERFVTKAVPPIVPPPMPAPRPGPAYVPQTRRASSREPVRAAARQVTGEPAAHVPHPGLARRQPGTASPPQAGPARREPGHAVAEPVPKKGKGGLIGCLVLLAALSGLLFNVVREIIEAVVDLVR